MDCPRPYRDDIIQNKSGQLLDAARMLITQHHTLDGKKYVPKAPTGWDSVIWRKMIKKKHVDRLVIAASLIAAEIDRKENQ